MSTLYRHKSLVRIVTWWPLTRIIMSVDTSNTILAWKMQPDKPSSWKTDTQLFQSRLDCGHTIVQILPGEEFGKFIISTRESDHFWSLEGQQEKVLQNSGQPRIRYWVQHPKSSLHIIGIDGAFARIYSWQDWSEIRSVCLEIVVDDLQLKSVSLFMLDRKPQLLLELSVLNDPAVTRELYSIDVTAFDINAGDEEKREPIHDSTHEKKFDPSLQSPVASTLVSPRLRSQVDFLADYVSHIIGISDSGKLVFLDTRSWVCSASLESTFGSSVSYSRHFFVPYDWFSGIRDILCGLTKRDVVFARHGDVAIIKGGLEFVEKVDVKHELLSLKKYGFRR
ncbi:hypothetical protein ONS95_001130 [Cadophora gregata]|uniref:uncharacterized protein n=1 Tax=Cadophora gregata TaxID=51156 RepID=UPI0026DA7773|nr:uncharacterized protein ONS95_001130 [Cadophora gregata]KAK0129195.1 hypothetical protein ONS95_001130 [Cadophora gregata]